MKKKLFLLSAFCICLSFIASGCPEDETVIPPPPQNNYTGIVCYTHNGGINWQDSYLHGTTGVQGVSCLSGDLSTLSIISNIGIMKSTDYGYRWNLIFSPEFQTTLNDITSAGEGKGFVVSSNQTYLLMTTDDGSSWAHVTWPTQVIGLRAIDFADGMRGMIIPEDPNDSTLITTDGGLSWTLGYSIPSTNYINAIKFVSSAPGTEAVVCGNNGTIFRTTNLGYNWTQITSPTNENLNSIDFSAPIGMIVGEHGTILRTTDGGLSWTDFTTSGLTNNLKKVYNDPGSLWWIVGDNIILKAGSGFLWMMVRYSTYEYYTDLIFIKNQGIVVGSRLN